VKKDPKVFLVHILECILLIEKYSKKVTAAKFHKDPVLQDAIIRRLEIIGEAVKNLPAPVKTQYSNIPWKQMAGMRDVLIHEYFNIDLFLTWKVVKQELPLIKKQLSAILADKYTPSK
jgi:uncharacterized protein with HEPN domain